jgi:hypothetical protein
MPWSRLFNFQAGTKINSGQVNAELNQLIEASNTNEQNFNDHNLENSRKHIKESGSNANGKYIKFDDGTMICTGVSPLFDLTQQFAGGLYKSTTTPLIAFPATFIDTNYIIYGVGARSWIGRLSMSQTTCNICIYGEQSYPATTINYVVIGRWK